MEQALHKLNTKTEIKTEEDRGNTAESTKITYINQQQCGSTISWYGKEFIFFLNLEYVCNNFCTTSLCLIFDCIVGNVYATKYLACQPLVRSQ